MATLTSRLKLKKPATTDTISIGDLNGNFDLLDANPGIFICTSTTRPASPFNGQTIYETDTKMEMRYRSDYAQWVPTQPIVHSLNAFPASEGTGSRLVTDLPSVVAKPYPRKLDLLLMMTISCGSVTGHAILEACGSIAQSQASTSQLRIRFVWQPEYDSMALTNSGMAYNIDLAANTNPIARVWINVVAGGANTLVETASALNEFVVIERVV